MADKILMSPKLVELIESLRPHVRELTSEEIAYLRTSMDRRISPHTSHLNGKIPFLTVLWSHGKLDGQEVHFTGGLNVNCPPYRDPLHELWRRNIRSAFAKSEFSKVSKNLPEPAVFIPAQAWRGEQPDFHCLESEVDELLTHHIEVLQTIQMQAIFK